jgi:hypothetical protein
LSPLHVVQTGFGAHPTTYPIVIADNIKAYTTAGVQTYNQGLPLEIEHTDNIYR